MHLGRLLASTVLFLLPLFVHAASIGEVNGANESLEEETDKYDGNVGKVNVVDGAIDANGIANDLATLNNAVASSEQNGEGTTATDKPGDEESVVNSFTAFSEALATYMQDLADKVDDLFTARGSIENTLGLLLSNYNSYAKFTEGLVVGKAYKAAVDNAGANAAEKIAVAKDAFEDSIEE